jgi:hypothetical protein
MVKDWGEPYPLDLPAPRSIGQFFYRGREKRRLWNVPEVHPASHFGGCSCDFDQYVGGCAASFVSFSRAPASQIIGGIISRCTEKVCYSRPGQKMNQVISMLLAAARNGQSYPSAKDYIRSKWHVTDKYTDRILIYLLVQKKLGLRAKRSYSTDVSDFTEIEHTLEGVKRWNSSRNQWLDLTSSSRKIRDVRGRVVPSSVTAYLTYGTAVVNVLAYDVDTVRAVLKGISHGFIYPPMPSLISHKGPTVGLDTMGHFMILTGKLEEYVEKRLLKGFKFLRSIRSYRLYESYLSSP